MKENYFPLSGYLQFSSYYFRISGYCFQVKGYFFKFRVIAFHFRVIYHVAIKNVVHLNRLIVTLHVLY